MIYSLKEKNESGVDMFKDYKALKIYSELQEQHNIFVLVGNGFDVSVLNECKSGKLPGKTTSYVDFYEYLTYFNLVNEENILYQQMKQDRKNQKKNWSDFENTIHDLFDSGENLEELENAIDEFQSHFTTFLNDVVDSQVLLSLNEKVKNNKLSIQSLGEFLKDIGELKQLNFVKGLDHYHLYNFVIANFNYTSLLDNYIYLDKSQFDPHLYKVVDRNFNFKYQFPDQSETNLSSYLVSEIIHPHGFQAIPRSILFGIDLQYFDEGTSDEKRLVKSYWSQYNLKYKSYLENAELFIIYGMSFGKTDAWWMDTIFDQLLKEKAELIIYKYKADSNEAVKNQFIDCCIRHKTTNKDKINRVKDKIQVVNFSENNTYFLGFESKKDCTDSE